MRGNELANVLTVSTPAGVGRSGAPETAPFGATQGTLTHLVLNVPENKVLYNEISFTARINKSCVTPEFK